MTDPHAKHPIDEIFRKSFDNLPAQADPSGWDTPSDKVWQNVQKSIRPSKGIGLKALGPIAAIAVAIVVGVVWLFSPSNNRPAAPVQTEESAEPASTTSEPASTTAEQPTLAPTAAPADSPANPPSFKDTKKDAQNKLLKSQKTKENTPAAQPANDAQPLPGSKGTLPPNSIEEKKQKSENGQGQDN
jgi:hypothetical protein